MAVLKKKSDGFNGKTGSTIVYELNGQIVRRAVGLVTAEPTALQLEVRQRTSLITALLKPVKEFIRIGFKGATEGTVLSPYNLATSMNRLQAIKGSYPDLEIDFTKVVFSKGNLPVNDQVNVAATKYGLEFSWDPALRLPGMKATDQVMVMAYCPEKRAAFSQLDGARRKDGLELISLPRYRETVLVHTYITFISSSRASISDSFYTGSYLW
ncbi:MAG TPA: DUF6266 family protein [Pedobacter sp.]